MEYDYYYLEGEGKTEHLWLSRPFVQTRGAFPLFLYQAGYGHWQPGACYERSPSQVFLVEYVRSGNIHLRQDGKDYVVQPGEVYLLRKGVAHEYCTGPAGFALKRYIQIEGPLLEPYLRTLDLWHRDHIPLAEPQAFEHHYMEITTLLARTPQDVTPHLERQLSCLMYQMLLELSQAIQPTVPPIIEKALNFMHQNLHRPLAREEICQHAGLSMPHFNRLFLEHLHCTPMAYFLQQKFEWTAQMLKTTSLTIKEVAYRAGFDDPLYFSAQFKKHLGVSPKHYRSTSRTTRDE